MIDATRAMLAVSRVAHAHWFFGDLYEAVVRMPDRLVDEHDAGRARGPFGAGSPTRYHLPAVPFVVVPTVLAAARTSGRTRSTIAVAATCSLLGAGISGYLVRTVNVRLLSPGPPIDEDERRLLVERWHRGNRVRLALLVVANVALAAAAEQAGRGGAR